MVAPNNLSATDNVQAPSVGQTPESAAHNVQVPSVGQAPERHSAARVSTVRGFLESLRAPSSHNEVTIIEQHISTRSASRLGTSQLFSMFRHSDNNQDSSTIREPLFSTRNS
ncbi:MAG: hypothetical protein CMF52_04080 [Legionellales bacterium]|nr:hypothetical protein [Legionellales bacterium]